MPKRPRSGFVALLFGLAAITAPAQTPADKPVSSAAAGKYLNLPLAFERQGTGTSERYVARGQGYTIGIQGGKATIGVIASSNKPGSRKPAEGTIVKAVSLEFSGGRTAKASPRAELPGKVNYVRGNDPRKWQLGLPTYGQVAYPGVYPGIDVVYYGNQQQLEFDFVVKPGADPGAIRMKVRGASGLSIDASGALKIGETGSDLRVDLPKIYQEVKGAKRPVRGHYALRGNDEVAFQVESYDRKRALVIDPTIVYSTLLGGGTNFSVGYGIALDASSNIIVTGYTYAGDFPTVNAAQSGASIPADGFVTKINAAGTAIMYSTYLGGSGSDYFEGIAVDQTSGAAWVTGYTASTDFPVLNATQTTLSGSYDAAVVKLSATGALQFSTYLGGSSGSQGYGIAVDSSENVYVTGFSYGNFPTTVNVLQGGVFVTKYGSTGTLLYSTTLGGGNTSGNDWAYGIAADGLGNAYVTGLSYSPTFIGAPAGGAQTVNNGGGDAYVAELNPTGTGLLYFTFLGGTQADSGEKIAIDGSGNAYIAGYTSSIGMATTGAAQTSLAGAVDGFVAKLNLTQSAFTYVSYLGGIRNDYLQGMAINGAGEVYVTGSTDSANFPVVSPLQATLPGNVASLYQSSNSAGSFSAFDSNIPGAVFDVSPDPVNAGTILAATEAGIYKTTNGGSSWTQQLAGQFYNGQASILARSPAAPATIYAAQSNLVYRSTDNGATWTYRGSVSVSQVGILADPLAADTVYVFSGYASTGNAAVSKSTDGGATWNPATTGLPAVASTAVLSEVAATDGSLYLVFYQNGVYKSSNQGGSWAAVDTGLPSQVYSYPHGLAASGTTVYLAFGQIYKTTNGGASWAAVPTSLETGAYQIAVSPQNASVIYALTSSNTVQESGDGGTTWSAPGTGLPPTALYYNVADFVVNPTDATDVFLTEPVTTAAFVAKLNSAGSAVIWSTYLDSGASSDVETGYAAGYGVATNGTGVFVTGYAETPGFPVTSTSFGSQSGNESAFVTGISDATATCSITLNPSTSFVSQYGGTVSFNVLAPSGCTWTASTDQPSWAPVSAGASGTGVGVVVVGPVDNSTGATRSTTLTVGTRTATITQPQDICSYSLDQSVYPASASGGAIPVVLTASAGCPWSVTNNYPGAISVGNPAGTGSGTITLTVARNTGLDPLNFTLAVGSTSISLIQAGTCLSLSASGAGTPIGGGTGSVNVIATNPACTWTATSSASWVTITSTGNGGAQQSGTGNGTVTWSSQASVTGGARTGVLPIAGLPYTITQGSVTGATTTSLGVSGNNPSTFGQSVTLTASVAPATAPGSVTFYNGPRLLGSGVLSSGIAQLTTTLLPAGTAHLNAVYVASGNFLTSASTVVAQTVDASPSGALTQATGSPIGAGTGPALAAVGDFNGDGIQDVAIANSGSSNVTVLLGNGLGGFTAAAGSPFTVGTGPASVAVGDFNGDGNQDLAVGNNNSNNVTVLLGNGKGGFSAATGSPFAAGAGPVSVAVGDFNGDGIADLAVADFTGNSVTILLGNGSGGFSAANGSPFASGSTPNSVAVGDFNGDGLVDLAVANAGSSSDKVTVLLGNGTGGFSAAAGSPFIVGTNPYSVVVGDFNGDGVPDFATANAGSNNVTVMLGNGTGGFSAAPNGPSAVGTDPNFVGIGDFNGDGIPDLVTANFNSNNVTILLGNGSAGFSPAVGSTVGTGAHSLAVGDFNGDGRTDLVAANFTSNNVTVLLGGLAATGSVLSTTSPATITAGTAVPLTLAVSDSASAFGAPTGAATFLDGATVLGAAAQTTSPYSFSAAGLGVGTHTLTATYSGDTRSATSTSNTVTVTVNASVPTPTISSLAPPSTSAGGPAFTLTVNGTNFVSGATVNWGATTLITTFISATQVTAAVGAGLIATAGPVSVTVANPGPVTSAAATFTVNTGGSTTSLLSSPSPSTFGQAVTLTATVAPAAATGKVTFYEGSTVLGIGTLSSGVAQLTTGLLPSGSGTLRAYYAGDANYVKSTSGPAVQMVNASPSGTLTGAGGSPFTAGTNPAAVVVGDFNGDGIRDVAIANSGDNNVTILLGNGSGGFTAAPGSPFAVGTGAGALAVGDFNADGIQDLVFASGTVLLGNGTGGFSAATGSPFAVGANPLSVAVADFNGDGIQDLAVAANLDSFSTPGNVTVLLGNGLGGFSAAAGSPFTAGKGSDSVAVGDFNGDGVPDLAVANYIDSTVTILLGTGAGGFSAATGSPFAAGVNPLSVTVGDFNGDGTPDLAFADYFFSGVTVLLGNGSGGFSAATNSPFAVGSGPYAVAVADFNGDGIADLAAANSGDNTVTVLLGDGTGGFSAATGSPFAVGSAPEGVAVGDFNGDGRTDLVVANKSSNNITVLLGGSAASGSVLSTTSPATITVGTAVPLSLAVSDTGTAFNAPTGTATFLDGATVLGTATQAASPYTFSATGLAVGTHTLTATYGGDTRSATSTSNTVTVTVNAVVPTPTISGLAPSSANAGGPAFTLTVNGTNFVSGATVNWGATALTTTFVSATQVTAAVGAGLITTAALVNITVANPGPVTSAAAFFPVNIGGSATTLLSSLTPSTFGQAVTLTATVAPPAATGKVTFYEGSTVLGTGTLSSGVAQLTTALLPSGKGTLKAYYPGNASYSPSTSGPAVQTVNANPSGTLTAASGSPFTVGTGPIAVATGDFNGDGIQDVAIADYQSSDVTILLGNGTGGFSAADGSPFAAGTNPYYLAVGDFNGDGVQDLAVGDEGSNDMMILLGNGAGGFSTAPGSPFAVGAAPDSLTVGDFNGDGISDLAIPIFASNSVTILLGNGAGGFSAASGSPFAVGTQPLSVVAADFNGDGIADLAVANSGSNNVTILLGNGAGGFSAATGSPFMAGTHPLSAVVGDFNGDGVADLAVANSGSSNVTLLLGNGSGGFSAAPASPFAVGTTPISVAVGDFNGDGIPDLSTANGGSNNVTVLLGNGAGGFSAAAGGPFAVGSNPDSVAAGDFNGDGKTDLVVSNNVTHNVTVLLGGSAATGSVLSTTAPSSVAAGTPIPLSLTVSDSATAFAAPTGTAKFYDGETLLGTATQIASPYLFSAAGLAVGTHTLTATYGGDTRSSGSTSNTVTITVNPAVTTPTISSLTPSSATAGGPAFTLTVNGTNFVSGATVEWGATALTTTFVSATQLTAAVAPAQIATAGPVNVTVANPGPIASAAATFTVLGPSISSLSPSSVTAGGPGFTLTVNGQAFAPAAAIEWNGTALVTTDVSATQLTASISAGLIASAGPAVITVTNPGAAAGSAPVPILILPTPAVTSVTPDSVSANSPAPVTIAGSSFTAGSSVSFTPPGGTATLITPSQIQAAQIAATIPAALLMTAGNATIGVQNGAGTLSNQLPFTIVAAGATPTISGMSPYSATTGGPAFTLTVAGQNFVASSTVQWGGTALTTTLVSSTQLTASVSAAQITTTGPVSITVVNAGPVTSAPFTFNVLAPTGQTWTQLTPTGGPPAARGGASAVFVPSQTTMVLFGGNGGPGVGLLNDTWTLDTTANQWSQPDFGGTPPPARAGAPAVVDSANLIMTIFGGVEILNSAPGCGNDVWTLSNSTNSWAQLSPTGTPPAGRNASNAVYDPVSNRMIVFGGDDACGGNATTFYNDVWVLTNANGIGGTPAWIQLTPDGTLPAGRAGASAVYDPVSNEMIIFGGSTVASVNDVWILTNANGLGATPPTWTQETPAGIAIPARAYHTAVYDPASNRMTVFGGQRGLAGNDTWVLSNANGLDGTPTWTQLAPLGTIPPIRTIQTAVLDSTTNRMIVFGGNASTTGPMFLNDVWALSDANNVTPFISTLSPNSVQTGGAAFTLTVNGQGFASGAVVQWNGTALTTSFVNVAQLTASVSSSLIASQGVASITVVNPGGATSAAAPFSVTTPPPPPPQPLSITSGAPPSGTFNVPYGSFTFTGSGGSGTNSWAVSGVPGLSVDPTSGILNGTPTTAGTFTLTVTLSNGGASISQNYPVTIAGAPLSITTTALPNGTQNQAYSAQLAGSGGSGSYQWAISGITGLTVNASSGAIGGSPTVGGTLTLNVTLSDASNAGATPATKAFTVAITFTPLSIKSSGALGGFAPGAAVTATFAATGGSPAYTWSVTGMPASLSLNPTTGQLTGTAPVNPGNYSFALTVSDTEKPVASASTTVTLSVLGFTTSTTLPSGTTSTSYSLNFTAAGGTPPYTFSGSVPAGLTLTGSGFLSGTPTSTGTTSFTVQVKDASGIAVTGTFSLTVASGVQPIQVTGAGLPDGSATASYSQPLEAQDGQPAYTWAVLGGALPDGLTLSSAGTISGTPTTPGLSTFTARATDSAGGFAAGVFTINVDPAPLQVTAAALPNGMAGLPYGAQPINATGGFAPYTFALTQGSLPAPLTFTSGQIDSGVPASPGTSSFTVTVTDSQGNTASQAFTLVIETTHPDLILSQGAVGFSIATNAVTLPAAASVTVGSSVANSLGFNFNVNPAAPWLDVTANGTTPGAVIIGLDPVNAPQLGKGIYQTSVVVSCLPLSGCSGSHSIAVTLTVTAPAPQLSLGTNLLSFSATGNSSQTMAQPLNLQNSGGGTVTIQSVSAADPWVKFDPATIPPPSMPLSAGQTLQVNVFADTTVLSGPGYYQSTITVTSDAGTATVPVTLLIAANATMTLSPAGSQYQTVAGNAPGLSNGSFAVSVSGNSTVNWTAAILPTSPAATWLTLNTPSGSSTSANPGTIGFSINGAAASLAAQPYYATIEVTVTGGVVTDPVLDYQVVLNVTAAGNIAAPNPDPQGLIFISTGPGTLPAQVVTVASSSAGVNYSATSNSPSWLSVSPASGTTSAGTPAQSSVSANAAGLANGVYFGGVNYAIAGQVRTVNVTLIVAAPAPGAATSGTSISGVTGKASPPGCTATRIIPTQTGLVNNFSLPTAWPTPLEITVTDDCGNPVTNGQVVATFSNDDPVLVLPVVGGSAGVYSGTWTPHATASQVTITAQATATGFKPGSVLITGQVTRNAAPVLNSGGTLNAFVPVVGSPLAPGMIVQIYGSNLASQVAVSSVIPLTTSLNNTSVIIGGVAAPLYFVSPGQINAQVPFELTPGSQYQVVVNANGQYSTPNPIQLAGDAPGIAAYASGGVIAEHADGTLVTEMSPAAPNEYVVFFVSGMGATDNPVASGQPSPGSPGLARPTDAPVLTLNGANVPIAFAGLTPTLVGLYQVNFQVPADAPNGDLQLVLTQSGGQSNSTILPVHN